MTTKNVESINSRSWSDLLLVEIRWVEDGRDVELVFCKLGQIRDNFTIVHCSWTSNLRMDIDLPPQTGGALLSIGAESTVCKNSGIKFYCNFGSNGSIKLVCSELQIKDS